MTYQQLSIISGVPLQTIQKVFAGNTKNPRIDTMQAIENALGIKTQTIILDSKKQELIDLVSKLNDESMEKVISIINLVLSK